MNNLENILNEKLDEGIFSAVNDIKGGMERGINSVKKGISNIKDKEKRDLESSVAKNASKKQSQEQNANGDSQVIDHLKKIKKKLYIALVNAVRAYEATDGENSQEKSNSKQFRRAKTEADAQYAAMSKTHENQKLKNPKFGPIPRDWTNLVKRLNNLSKNTDDTKTKLNTIASVIGYKAPFGNDDTKQDTKPAKEASKGNKYSDEDKLVWANITKDPELVKHYMNSEEAMNKIPLKNRKVITGLNNYYKIFGSTKTAKPLGESMIDEFLNALSEDVDTFEMAKQIMTNFYSGVAEGIALRKYMAEQAVEAFARYIEGMSDETKQAELKKLMGKKEEKEEKEEGKEKPNDIPEEEEVKQKKYKSAIEYTNKVRKSAGEDEIDEEGIKLIKRIIDKYQSMDYETASAVMILADEGMPGKTIITIKNKEIRKDEFMKNLGESLTENYSKIPDIVKAIEKVEKPVDKSVLIKKKIAKLQTMYSSSNKQEQFKEYVNKALKSIGITPKSGNMGINATKILGWLDIAKNSTLKNESIDFELELYKEDIVDILVDKSWVL